MMPVVPTITTFPLPVELPDATDTMFVEVASAAGADCVVTGNRKHFPSSPSGSWRVCACCSRESSLNSISAGALPQTTKSSNDLCEGSLESECLQRSRPCTWRMAYIGAIDRLLRALGTSLPASWGSAPAAPRPVGSCLPSSPAPVPQAIVPPLASRCAAPSRHPPRLPRRCGGPSARRLPKRLLATPCRSTNKTEVWRSLRFRM